MNTLRIAVAIYLLLSTNLTSAQNIYSHDRVYTANQISNTVSVIDPSRNKFLGEIKLGAPFTNVLSPLYKGQVLVHGLRYSPQRKMLAVVSIGSNSVTFISTENNRVIKTIYVGRAPHEPTFTPDSKQVWITIRGEAYISVIDVDKMKEIREVPVADGPGMICFSQDGKIAYVCSSFTPELDIVNTQTYKVFKKISVASPFSPNIFISPDGKWVALTHKDVGKITVINTKTLEVEKLINSGLITNHVTFVTVNDKLLMIATVGGENKVKVYDVADNFELIGTIAVDALPHGLWSSPDGRLLYVGLEYSDEVQCIDLKKMIVVASIQIGQSPQALVYAHNAVTDINNQNNLSQLNDSALTQVIVLQNLIKDDMANGRLAVRSIGLTDLIEQAFNLLRPGNSYTLALTKSTTVPFSADYEINSFISDGQGKYNGQSTGLLKSVENANGQKYRHIILIDNSNKQIILLGNQ